MSLKVKSKPKSKYVLSTQQPWHYNTEYQMSDPWLKRCLILLLDKLNCATDLSMLLCLGCRLEVDKNRRSLPCSFKIQPPVKHCSAIGIMNHPNHTWSGLLVAISSCHGFVPPRLRVEFIYFFLWVNPPACGTIPEISAFAFLAFFTRTSVKAGGEDKKKIPFIPGVKMHSVDIALSPKKSWLDCKMRSCAMSFFI